MSERDRYEPGQRAFNAYCRAIGIEPHESRPAGAPFYVIWCGARVAEWAASLGFPQPHGLGVAQAHLAGHAHDDCTAWMLSEGNSR